MNKVIPMIDPIPQKIPPSILFAIISPFESFEDRSNGCTGAGVGSFAFLNFGISHISVAHYAGKFEAKNEVIEKYLES